MSYLDPLIVFIFTQLNSVAQLAELGGVVIWGLALLAFILWVLLFERLISLYWLIPARYDATINHWFSNTSPSNSWQVEALNLAFETDVKQQSYRFLSTIKTLIGLCPLFGLLGTVTGMVSVFDVIAVTGTSDAKAMASGIFKATLPTMTGLFLAVTALYFQYLLVQKAEKNTQLFKRYLSEHNKANQCLVEEE